MVSSSLFSISFLEETRNSIEKEAFGLMSYRLRGNKDPRSQEPKGKLEKMGVKLFIKNTTNGLERWLNG